MNIYRKRSFNKFILLYGVASFVSLQSGVALAQQAGGADASKGLEDIIVTATRQSRNVQDIPIPANVLDATRLQDARVKSASDLQFVVPGLKVANVSGLARITLRGIGANGLSPTAETGVASYLDGVFLGSAYYQSRAFFDLDRVEVLRGPQGTLYGRNATGGAINIVSKAPTDTVSGAASVTLGNYDLVEAEGFLSGPLVTDKLRARIAYSGTWHDGYTPNSVGRNQDNANAFSLRGRLVYDATDRLSIDLGGDYSRDRSRAAIVAQRVDPAKPLLYELLGGSLPTGRRIAQDANTFNHIRAGGARGTVTWDFDAATLTSITAYRKVRNDNAGEFDYTDLPIATVGAKHRSHQFTQDIYIVSKAGRPLEWTVGSSYFREVTSTSVDFNAVNGRVQLGSPRLSTSAYAAYGELTYNISSRIALSGGVRYTHEKKSFEEADIYSGIFSPIAPASLPVHLGPFRDSWNKVTPHASLSYKPAERVMVYASYSKGFKAGGFNSLSSQTSSFDPENSTNYEVGIKSEWLDRRLRVNASAFWNNYDGLQVQQRIVIPPSPLAVLIINNAASARIRGLELELVAQPVEGLTLSHNLAYLDATYRRYDAINELQPNSPLVLVDGNRLNSTPRWSGNTGLQYRFAAFSGTMILNGDWSFQTKVYNNATNAEALTQSAYSAFNANISFDSGSDHWLLTGWIRNITDKQVYAARSAGAIDPAGGQAVISYYLPPRTFGVTLEYRF
ncbi:TonB dependent receptor [Rhizorhabdus wittichii DC-6]|nr:TonB dependent receptor [Rhizorhabdus wittichii DC-6]